MNKKLYIILDYMLNKIAINAFTRIDAEPVWKCQLYDNKFVLRDIY